MPLPALGAAELMLSAAARYLASKGATKAIKKYGSKAVDAAKKEISKYKTTKSKPDAIARAKKEKRIEQKVRNRQPGRSSLSKGTEDTLGKAVLGTAGAATAGGLAGSYAIQVEKQRERIAEEKRTKEKEFWDASKARKAKASGGRIKSYTRGGSVRGAGIATKGSRPCKMR